MLGIVAFKLLQFTILGLFIAFISDFRNKKGMSPLIGEKWTYLLMISYFVPLAAYAYVVLTINWLSTFDVFALVTTVIGTSLIIKAKRDLSTHHTWVGYCLPSTKFTTNGIYSYIRHPIYTGIYVVIIGSLFTIIPHINLVSYITLVIVAVLSVAYTMGFLAFLANKETKTLLKKHGAAFQQYKEKVHPFFPLRKYTLPVHKKV